MRGKVGGGEGRKELKQPQLRLLRAHSAASTFRLVNTCTWQGNRNMKRQGRGRIKRSEHCMNSAEDIKECQCCKCVSLKEREMNHQKL